MENSLSTKRLIERYAPANAGKPRFERVARFWLRAKLQGDLHRRWFDMIDRPALRSAVKASPNLCARLQHPYVTARLTQAQRYNLLRKHFELMCRIPDDVRVAIYSPEGLTLAAFEESGIQHLIKLVHQPGTEREGDLSLVWDCSLGRVAMATFVLLNSRRGMRALVVGGIQGARGGDIHAMYQVLTRDMHGMRPMSALVHFLQLAAQKLGVGALMGVEDTAHAMYRPGRNCSYKKTLSYDTIWQEHGGTAWEYGLYRIPLQGGRRDLAEVASKKRSMYRKRYALLDRIDLQMGESLRWADGLPSPRVETAWVPGADLREAIGVSELIDAAA